MDKSKLLWLTEQTPYIIRQWESLEEELRRAYEDEEREVGHLESLEESELSGTYNFEVESTGALLDLDNAKKRLQNFCSTLAKGDFIDSRPDYILSNEAASPPGAGIPLRSALSAVMLLPPFVPEQLRSIKSKSTWLSEKSATKEAAFHACVALYEAGLLNEHLLPLFSKVNAALSVEARAPKVDVEPPFNPWYNVATAWDQAGQRWLYSMAFGDENEGQIEYQFLLPTQLNQMPAIELFLDAGRSCRLQLGPPEAISEQEAASWPDQTSTLLALPFAHRWQVEDIPQVVKFTAKGTDLSRTQIGSARFDARNEDHSSGRYLIRDRRGTPFVYKGKVAEKPPMDMVQHPFIDYDLAPGDEPYLVLTRWTKHIDFLHRRQAGAGARVATTKRYPWVLP